MVQVSKTKKGDLLEVSLAGSVEENVDFEVLLGVPPKVLKINCKDISRINSVGVKAWIKYFQICQTNKVHLTFVECPAAIVEQINLISNFTCGGHVESIYLPFVCLKCGSELSALFKTHDLKEMQLKVPTYPCPKCGGTAEFDDLPEEYLGFLSR